MEPATVFVAVEPVFSLPEIFAHWFAGRGWTPRAHQFELLAKGWIVRLRGR